MRAPENAAVDKSADPAKNRRSKARTGAQSAASAPALAARVRELETVLAVERAENAKRLREVDGHMRVMRTSLGELQTDFRRLSEERQRLRGELTGGEDTIKELEARVEHLRTRAHDVATEREGAAASAVSAAISRAQEAETVLTSERKRVVELEAQLLEARAEGEVAADHRIRELERRVGEREMQLIRAADMLDRYEKRLERSEERTEAAVSVAQQLSEQVSAPSTAGRDDAAVVIVADSSVDLDLDLEPDLDPGTGTDTDNAAPGPEAHAPEPDPAVVAAPTSGTDTGERDANDLAESDTFEPGDLLLRYESRTGDDSESDDPQEAETSGRRRRRRSRDRSDRDSDASGSAPYDFESSAVESGEDPVLENTDDEVAPLNQKEHAAYETSLPPVDAERLPDIEGVEIEGALAAPPAGRHFHGRVARTRRAVLVRMLPARLQDFDESKLERLVALRHANLASLLSFGISRLGPFLVAERPDGETAEHVVRRGGSVPEDVAIDLVRQVARGLRDASFRDFLHGDLTPWSVRVSPGNKVKVYDVGSSVLCDLGREPPTNPAFAAPERLNADGEIDERSDIYSLGGVLYYLLTGRPPFERSAEDVARRDPTQRCPSVREANPSVSEETAQFMQDLTHPDAASRPASWDHVLIEMDRLPPPSAGDAPAGDDAATGLRGWLAEHPLVTLAGAVLPLVCAALAFLVLGPGEPTPRERFEAVELSAQELAAEGDVDGARKMYAAFLRGTGDPDVERDAAARIDALYK